MAFDHSKFLARFVEEAREHCSRISDGLLNLEKSPGDSETINGLFRSAHTIKGSSRMMKLSGITMLAHKMEDVLDAVRGGKMPLTPPVSDVLFRGVDALLLMLGPITDGDTSGEAPAALCEELAVIATVSAAGEAPESLSVPAVTAEPDHATVSVEPVSSVEAVDAVDAARPAASVKKRQVDYLRVDAAKIDDLIRLMGEIVSEQGRFRRHIGRLCDVERATALHLKAVEGQLHGGDTEQNTLIEAGAALQLSLRQSVRAMYDASLLQDHLVGDLQGTSLRMRMQPLSTVFDPLRRTVRDLAREQGKDVDFVVEGGDTELDRKIIDRIGDSLMHMIRNSLDHGVENAEERVAAGKPAQGTINLAACYDSGCVTISLGDDGRGLSVEKIREKALAKRLFDADTLAGMSRAEITDMIFMPGFSTSPIITDISGRGVGMDVVRKSIVDELKGTIIIETREGEGTTFLLRLPLNLAVFPLFLLSTGGKTCALPATSLVEMLSVQRGEIIEIVNKRAIRLREQIIPVESLAALLRLAPETPAEAGEVLVVIIRDGEEKLGLVVDEIIGREEMVVKPLPLHLQNLRMVSGVTIGEQDSIINVLHVPELIRQAREIAEPGRQRPTAREDHAATVLVVDDSINTREIEKSILEAYGYTVVTAEDGEEAFEKTRETLYDIVITDVEMPRLDGFSLTKRLREDERYRHVPIIIVTSLEKDEDKKRGITVGANAYIVKGAFDQSNLIETVRSLIG
ncbi:MAG: hybrid sensor histidine kinase/response regulator [Desulfuromonadaceae bacterium]|nr:hybrid sensor histidine kinase/response regulator [Desulfuromonadaceae bacterium]MDD2848704.1 hybrid sensor histidine kinase/response regulator [Desulfuromonadaceae bacterium]MDD4130793.1 hybrid sensor histidine kinase/response regulator [Desulfuromonadaceae bacterium]